MRTPFVVLALLAPLPALLAQAPGPEQSGAPVNKVATGFLDKTIAIGGSEHRYVVYVPPGYAEDRRWPLIMFLHGMGECGTDGKKQIEVGLAPAMRKDPERWPFVVVFPQKPDKESQWADHEALVKATLAATEKECRIDESRRFLTGLSQGGAGAWSLGSKHADTWAAIAPVCGYGKPAEVAPALKTMPIWAFHGVDDLVVPAQQSKNLCAAVEKASGSPVLTLHEKTGHNSWDKAYRESNLAEWFRVLPLADLAKALADPQGDPFPVSGLAFDFVSHRGSVTTFERTKLWSSGPGEWHRGFGRWSGEEAPSESRDDVRSDAATARCFAECVRQLARAGIFDAESGPDATEPDWVEVHGIGQGDASLRTFTKRFPVGRAASPQVEAIRKAVESIRSLR